MKHTKGPWEISVNEKEQFDICEAGGGDMLADLSQCDNQEANAHLISAAPELLEACNAAFINLTPVYPCDHLVIKLLRQAMDKAEGKN